MKAVRGQANSRLGLENTVLDSVLEKSKKIVLNGVGVRMNSRFRVLEMGCGA